MLAVGEPVRTRVGVVWLELLDRVAIVALDLDLGVEREAVDVAAQFTRQEQRASSAAPPAIVQDPGRFGCAVFHKRSGRIPAPLISYRN
jgi:hypothetical protein